MKVRVQDRWRVVLLILDSSNPIINSRSCDKTLLTLYIQYMIEGLEYYRLRKLLTCSVANSPSSELRWLAVLIESFAVRSLGICLHRCQRAYLNWVIYIDLIVIELDF